MKNLAEGRQLVREKKELDKKLEASGRALRAITGELRDIGLNGIEGMDEDLAIQFGTEFVVRYLEIERLGLDITARVNELGRADWYNPIFATEASSALAKAAEGDFTGVKKFVSAQALSRIREEETDLLKALANRMPDVGAPFKMPPPAWMDMRFAEPGPSH